MCLDKWPVWDDERIKGYCYSFGIITLLMSIVGAAVLLLGISNMLNTKTGKCLVQWDEPLKTAIYVLVYISVAILCVYIIINIAFLIGMCTETAVTNQLYIYATLIITLLSLISAIGLVTLSIIKSCGFMYFEVIRALMICFVGIATIFAVNSYHQNM